MTLKDIFDNMKGEWDWFDGQEIKRWLSPKDNSYAVFAGPQFTLADLLANQSWCRAVWGEDPEVSPLIIAFAQITKRDGLLFWQYHSTKAFQILQSSEQEAIDYIYNSMLK